MDMNTNQSFLIHSNKIPQRQIQKFTNTLEFLKHNQLQHYVEQQFIQRIKNEAQINQQQLNDLFLVIKVEKQLLNTMKTYFSIAFNHQSAPQSFQISPLQSQLTSNCNQPNKKHNPWQEYIKTLHDRLMTLSSYQNLSVKILIESLLFLKNVFHQQFFHKKLINQFQKNQFHKKFEVWHLEIQKQRTRSLLKKNKHKIYFRQEISHFQNDNIPLKTQNKQRHQSPFSIVKSKVFTIAFLEYEKLQTKSLLFHSHLQLLQKCISERENILNFYLAKVLEKNNYELDKILEFQNSTFYLILKWFQLRIQFSAKDHEYMILKDIKQKKKSCKGWRQSVQNSILSCEKQKNEKLLQLLNSNKIYLKNLQSLKDKIKIRVGKQLMGDQGNLGTGHELQSKAGKKVVNTKTNYQRIKQTIYELTLSCLNEGGNKTISRNVSNERILEQYIKNHDQMKMKNESDFNYPAHSIPYQQTQNDQNNKISREQIQKTRSLTVLRQNLHKNIFLQQSNPKYSKSKLSQNSSISRRTRSLFNSSKQAKDEELSIKNLLQSPLNRQIQIFLEYQKFINQSDQNPVNFKQSPNPVRSNTKSRFTDQSVKPINEGFKLIDQINKYSNQQKKDKKLLTSQKKKKIQTIYKAFAYNNKIVDISHWKLQEQIQSSQRTFFFNKKQVKTQLTDPICHFGAGRKNLDAALQQLFAQRCYMMINYIKVWQAKPCLYKIRMSQQNKNFTLYMKLNDFTINLVLPRGQNILCQRFQTIWPTIRYLLQKKIFQFSVIKFFQNIFHQKKISQLQNNSENPKDTSNLSESSSQINSVIHKKTSEIPKNQQFEENDCTFFEKAFGIIQSDEVEQINSCLDSIHKFMGLIFGQTKRQNGRKQIIHALQDNQHKKEIDLKEQNWEKEKQNSFKLYNQESRMSEEWKRAAKCWVALESQEQLHLLSFLKKYHQEGLYLLSVSIDRFELSKVMTIYMCNISNQNPISQQTFRDKYLNEGLKFKITWRKIQQNYSTQTKDLPFSQISISLKKLCLYQLGIDKIHDYFLKIATNSFYHKKIIHPLKTLVSNSVFISTSVEGEKLYDLSSPHHTKKNHLLNPIPPFKDYYKLNQSQKNFNLPYNQFKKSKKYPCQNTFSNLNHIPQKQQASLGIPSIHLTSNKTQIQIIQNYMDILTWHNSENQIKFKPNSKWKIVKKKIHNVITFVTHLSKKTQRKSSLLTTQKIRQDHQLIEQQTQDCKKKQKVSPLMMKSLPKMKKSTISFLEKIHNELYRVKVNILESTQQMCKQTDLSEKWMGEIILIKGNSKQYTKFYISSADIETIFKHQTIGNFQNQSLILSESYEMLDSKKVPEPKFKKRFSQNTVMRQNLRRKKSQISEQILEIDSLKLTNKSDSCENQNQFERRADKIQSLDYEQSFRKRNKSMSWDFMHLSLSNMKQRQITDRKVKMFRKIVGLISFTKIKCFNKIVISKTADLFYHKIQRFIAQPRSSLEVLHQTTENPEKIFELKYFNLLQNCYQTIICKPIKIYFKQKTDYVIITLFKIKLKNHHLYQFRINLNKNQTYYACQLTNSELTHLIQYSQKLYTQTNSNHTNLNTLLPPSYKSDHFSPSTSNHIQPVKTQDMMKSSQKKSSNLFMKNIQYDSPLLKKRTALKKYQSRNSNFLNFNQISPISSSSQEQVQEQIFDKNSKDLITLMVSKLEEYSKQILETILKKIQVTQQVDSNDEFRNPLYLEIPQANFKKELKLRVLERISKDENSVYLVELNEQKIRELNQIVIKTSMNKNFDIFKQNIFKKSVLSTDKKYIWNGIIREEGDFGDGKLENQMRGQKQGEQTIRGRKSQNQNEINLLFSSFNLEQYKNGNHKGIEEMNQESVIESIEYEVERKFGKELVMKFNNKKIKHYAEIFFKYFLKYIHTEPNQLQNQPQTRPQKPYNNNGPFQ